MDYRKGYIIKPYEVTNTGQVLFTDGTNNNLIPNQSACEAYGYTYDNATGTCSAFNLTSKIDINIGNKSNYTMGGEAVLGTHNTILNGAENKTNGNNANILLSGKDNQVANGIKNATVLGLSGEATRQSEVVIGGGVNNLSTTVGELSAQADPRRQMSVVELAGITVDNTATNLTVNGDGSSYINVRNNSIVGYEIYLTRLETGGTSGTAGNYSYRNLKGVVQIDNSYNMAFLIGFTRNIGKIGVNGTFTMVDTSTSDLKSISVQVTDRNNVNNVWSAIVYIHELALTKITF